MLWLLLLLLTALFLLTSATLNVYHGRVYPHTGVIQRVDGIAALNLNGPTVFHFFDCNSTSTSPTSLAWEREDGVQRFPAVISGSALRLNMAPTVGSELRPITSSDVGIYTCKEITGSKSVSVKIVGESVGVFPVVATTSVVAGGSVDLVVHVDGDPPVASEEIMWTGPQGDHLATTSPRVHLQRGRKWLSIEDVELADSGTYNITITRFSTIYSASIQLTVLVAPAVTSHPVSAVVLEHDAAMLSCVVTGNPLPTVIWEREGNKTLPVITRRTTSTRLVRRTSTGSNVDSVISDFIIRRVLRDDQGRYRCVASNVLGVSGPARSASNYATLEVMPRLLVEITSPLDVINTEGRIAVVSEDSRVVAHCLSSHPVLWTMSPGDSILVETGSNPSSRVYQRNDPTNSEQTLFIREFSRADISTYTCSTSVPVRGEVFSESLFITSANPAVYIAESVIFVKYGSPVQIRAIAYASSQSDLVINWFHEGIAVNEAESEYVSVMKESMYGYALSIAMVDSSHLGQYEVVATLGANNTSDTVQLALPDPPTATVFPALTTVLEGGRASFQCQAGGTQASVVWSLSNGQALPRGVQHSGSELVIEEADRHHAQQYKCTVTNIVGASDTSVAMLIVSYAPSAVISIEGSVLSSTNHTMNIVAAQGDAGPALLCSSDASPLSSHTWHRVSEGNGVMQEIGGRRIVWERPLVYDDSGQYVCNATNSIGESTVAVHLLVKRLPVITSIYLNSPLISHKSTEYSVPSGLSGEVVTCTAFGWPAPYVEWQREGHALAERMWSEFVHSNNSAYASARLISRDGFQQLDAGNFVCVVRDLKNSQIVLHSYSISITTSDVSVWPSISQSLSCSANALTKHFKLQLLDTDCLNWDDGFKQKLARILSSGIIQSVISSECHHCAVSSRNVEVHGVRCSERNKQAVLVAGVITSQRAVDTADMFCALERWKEHRPSVILNGLSHALDLNCNFNAGSNVTFECSYLRSSTNSVMNNKTVTLVLLSIILLLLP